MLVYACGLLLPVIVALCRSELMVVIGVPMYTVLFWSGPFVSAAAVIWSDWSAVRRAVWILAVPVIVVTLLGLVFVLPGQVW